MTGYSRFKTIMSYVAWTGGGALAVAIAVAYTVGENVSDWVALPALAAGAVAGFFAHRWLLRRRVDAAIERRISGFIDDAVWLRENARRA